MSRRKIRETTAGKLEFEKYMRRLKFEKESDKFNLSFPLVNEEGDVRVYEIPYFKVKHGKTLADGKWHSFQLPEDDEVYEMCKNHPYLEEVVDRVALIVVYDADLRKQKKDIPYHFEYMKLTETRAKLLDEMIDEALDEGYESIDQCLILAKLNKSKNAVKMQDFTMLLKGDSPAYNNRCVKKNKDILKEAEQVWKELPEKVVTIEDDDTIITLLDVEEEEEDSKPRRRKKSPAKKRRMSRKDLD